MDLKQIENAFDAYVSSFDCSDGLVSMKISHSRRVMKISEEIASSLSLSGEDTDLAMAIGLLHDAGRFVQAEEFHTFRDVDSLDHGMLGEKILRKKESLTVTMTEEEKNILYAAVRNHNKLYIEDGLDKRTLQFCRIIRDADKIDILRLRASHQYDKDLHLDLHQMEQQKISDEIFERYMHAEMIPSALRKNDLDGLVLLAAFPFDLNTEYALKIVQQEDLAAALFMNMHFANPITQQRVNQMVAFARIYQKQ